MHAAPIASAIWLWAAPEAATAIATRDLPTILRTYRRLTGLSQIGLAELLGYDKSYVSMLETGRRAISDVATRRHIAAQLAIPSHVLGVTGTDDAEFRAMLQFGDSTVRLAEIARQAGQAVEAVNELWPLVARLESRAAEGRGSGLLFQPFTLREIQLRGLMGTGRTVEAGQLVHNQVGSPSAPQWRIIERVTTGEVLASLHEADAAQEAFTDAIEAAEVHRLPHQIQRTVRATIKAGMDELAAEGRAALHRLRSRLSATT